MDRRLVSVPFCREISKILSASGFQTIAFMERLLTNDVFNNRKSEMNPKHILFRLAIAGWLATAFNTLMIDTIAMGQGIGTQAGERASTGQVGQTGLGESPDAQEPESTPDKRQTERFAEFEKLLTKSKLVGRFTVLGDDDRELRDEVYFIDQITKMEQGDYWLFKARLKFESHDFSAPLPLEVQWAGDTPVITLTDFTIPGLGTFDSRVLFYNHKYAGTWTHGDKGGHLFGVIEPAEEPAEEDAEEDADEDATSKGETTLEQSAIGREPNR